MKEILLLSIVSLLLIFATGCINNDNNTDDKEYRWMFLYEVKLSIQPEDNEGFILYLPIPIMKSDESVTIPNFIQPINIINGSITTEIINSEYGKALKVVGNGEFHIKNYFETIESDYENIDTSRYNKLSLTTSDGTSDVQNIYLNTSSDSSFLISINSYMKYETPRGTNNHEWEVIDFPINNEWNEKDMFSYEKSKEY